MEFKFPLNDVFAAPVVEIGHTLIPPGFTGDRRALWDVVGKVTEVVNAMGEASASAQGLTKPITTAERLRNSEHKIYLLVDQNSGGGRGAVTGMLKIGKKGLYVFDRNGQHYQVSPPCVLDFYIHESRQRTGLGKRLFEHMLQSENVQPVKMAIDRPSDKFLGFLNKHYTLSNPVKQMNNYVVFDGFFPSTSEKNGTIDVNQSGGTPGKKQSANGLQTSFASPLGRYGAPRPLCSMGQIIHNQTSTIPNNPEPTGVTSIRSAPETNYHGASANSPQNPTIMSQSAPNVSYQPPVQQYQQQQPQQYQQQQPQQYQQQPQQYQQQQPQQYQQQQQQMVEAHQPQYQDQVASNNDYNKYYEQPQQSNNIWQNPGNVPVDPVIADHYQTNYQRSYQHKQKNEFPNIQHQNIDYPGQLQNNTQNMFTNQSSGDGSMQQLNAIQNQDHLMYQNTSGVQNPNVISNQERQAEIQPPPIAQNVNQYPPQQVQYGTQAVINTSQHVQYDTRKSVPSQQQITNAQPQTNATYPQNSFYQNTGQGEVQNQMIQNPSYQNQSVNYAQSHQQMQQGMPQNFYPSQTQQRVSIQRPISAQSQARIVPQNVGHTQNQRPSSTRVSFSRLIPTSQPNVVNPNIQPQINTTQSPVTTNAPYTQPQEAVLRNMSQPNVNQMQGNNEQQVVNYSQSVTNQPPQNLAQPGMVANTFETNNQPNSENYNQMNANPQQNMVYIEPKTTMSQPNTDTMNERNMVQQHQNQTIINQSQNLGETLSKQQIPPTHYIQHQPNSINQNVTNPEITQHMEGYQLNKTPMNETTYIHDAKGDMTSKDGEEVVLLRNGYPPQFTNNITQRQPRSNVLSIPGR